MPVQRKARAEAKAGPPSTESRDGAGIGVFGKKHADTCVQVNAKQTPARDEDSLLVAPPGLLGEGPARRRLLFFFNACTMLRKVDRCLHHPQG